MKTLPKSIAEQIDCLARLTNAPHSFVTQVRKLFSRKGIPLDADATPYLKALEEAFVREEKIRTGARRLRRRASGRREEFERLGRDFVRHHAASLEPSEEVGAGEFTTSGSSTSWLGSGRGRSVVLRQHTEDGPVVPGPTEPQ